MIGIEDLLRPIETFVSDLIDSGWIWAVLIGIIGYVIYLVISRMIGG